MARGGALLLQLVKDQIFQRRIDVEASLDAHVGHEARFYGPGRRVVSTEKLHLLLVGAHGRRDLLAEGGHGCFVVFAAAAVQKSVARWLV